MNDLTFRITQNYDNLTPSARKIADHLRIHYAQAQYLSISDLATECGVAEATIFRFCRSLGFSGYNELRLAMAKASLGDTSQPYAAYTSYGEITAADTVETMAHRLYTANMEALAQTLARTDEAAVLKAGDLLEKAGKVYCFGSGGSQIIAMEAWSRFLTISAKFFTIQDGHAQVMAASLLAPDDVVLYVSYSGSTREAADVLGPARARGAKVLLVTHDADSPATGLADVVLLCGGHEGPLQAGSIAAKMALLFVVDLLVNEYCRRNKQATMHNKDLTTTALACRHL